MFKKVSVLAVLLASTSMMPVHMAHAKTTVTKTAMTSTMSPSTDQLLSKADSDMKKVLDAQKSLGPKPIETLTAAEARKQPSPADGAKKVLSDEGKDPNDSLGVVTHDTKYETAGGEQPIRVYKPKDAGDDDKLPVIVYYHGGGFVIADIDTYDSTPRALSKAANAVVISVEYRHAPENKFPAQQDDAFAAYQWVLKNAAKFGGDVSKVAVVGESAGGNLAINTAIKARDEKIEMPVAEVLVYPVAGVDMNTQSYIDSANAKPLNKAMMAWFIKNTIRSDADKQDPRLDIIGKADLQGLPPTTIINAEIDPLRSDGQLLAEKLNAAGVKVNRKVYEGSTHEFFGMGLVVDDAKDAEALAVKDLKNAFDKADDNR